MIHLVPSCYADSLIIDLKAKLYKKMI